MEDFWKGKPEGLKELVEGLPCTFDIYKNVHQSAEDIQSYADEQTKEFANWIWINSHLLKDLKYSDSLVDEFKKTLIKPIEESLFDQVAIVSPIEESLFDKALSQVPNDIKESVDKDFLIINLQKENAELKESLAASERMRAQDAMSAINEANNLRKELESLREENAILSKGGILLLSDKVKIEATNKELLEGLKNITERSKRAQGILRKEIGNEDCWHMLNTDKQFELIKKHDK